MVKLKAAIAISKNDEDALLLDVRRGVYWHLNPVGVSVAEALESERSLDELVKRVTDEFDVDHEIARRDVSQLLKSLKKARLIEGKLT